MIIGLNLYLVQGDAAFKQKQREEKKKMAEAQARAGQKGPMGESLGQRARPNDY